ncbi:hypothetical protein [Deinococcus peraridilitoris]|uniref:Organic solvent tolerance-like N-terminal domain-containing protein n=1 Tax=Deinococcus peraridilitoris (strain DSM 19664 / LMG 22246 / CIP 109416 / KR-200) TaxID=937777 RepID=L0A4U5_DEIPD|nr:hypothetical protein [Deinococcus peraridilitoris]AFZ68459.1 hypothetical protein Deipe_3009 [Deinococcus peraridilitoris DSM 19664]
MLKYSWLALGVLLAFGVIVALLPEGEQARSQPGVTLSGVNLRLYPQQDQEAEWRFRAQDISFDPLSGETEIVKPTKGERLLRGKLDMTISTERLVIDSSDNLQTLKAQLYIPSQCTTLDLEGTAETPVRIDQTRGYTAPTGKMSSPGVVSEIANLVSSFQLDAQGDVKKMEVDPDASGECVDGKLVNARGD